MAFAANSDVNNKSIVDNITNVGKLAVGLVGYPLLTIACAIGTVAGVVFFALAKAVTFFIPKEWSQKIDSHVEMLGKILLITGHFTAHNAHQIYCQFLEKKARKVQEDKFDGGFEVFQDRYVDNLTAICNAHINGSR